jgi:hypothetical protein
MQLRAKAVNPKRTIAGAVDDWFPLFVMPVRVRDTCDSTVCFTRHARERSIWEKVAQVTRAVVIGF